MLKKTLIFIILLSIITLLPITQAKAAEGIIELESVNGSKSRCYAMSIMPNREVNYQLLISCKSLIYPVEPEGEYYLLWGNSIGKESKPILIGDLSLGKTSFSAYASFSGLFATKEQTQNPEKPSNNIVMQGQVMPISFLELEPAPSVIITPSIAIKPSKKINQSAFEDSSSKFIYAKQKLESVIKSSQKTQSKTNIISQIQNITIAVIIIIIIIAIIIFVIYIIYRIIKSRS